MLNKIHINAWDTAKRPLIDNARCIKKLLSPSDLAINGAPPLFELPLHVGRPNIGNREALLHRINDMLDRRWLSNNGPLVQEFERKTAEFLGVKHCIAMCNGTIALEIAIRALGLTGEVIVPSFTFIATAHALSWQGITPVFADIDPATHNLDPAAVERMITPSTTGIIGVHLWGRPCAVEALQDLANKKGLQLMFDSSHAFGCGHRGIAIGNFGRCEVFSFHATKFFNTFEGGAVATNDDSLAHKMRLMKNFGFAGYDNVIHYGTNGKMTEICAAMGLTELEAITDFVAANRTNYQTYKSTLAGIPGVELIKYDHTQACNLQYIVLEIGDQCPVRRDDLLAALHAENILARRYFWPGCHRMQPYALHYPHAGLLLPETERLADRIIILPTGTSIAQGTVKAVASVIRACAAFGSAALCHRDNLLSMAGSESHDED